MLTTILVLLALGGVTAGCLYTPDANGHVVVPDASTLTAPTLDLGDLELGYLEFGA